MAHAPPLSPLSRLLFVSASTHTLGHVSDIEVFRSAARHNNKNNISGVILRGETWFCQVLEGAEQDLQPTWKRIHSDARHACAQHWWETGARQRLFTNWHTEHWGVSPQIERVFLEMIRSNGILTADKIILVRAFAQVRRSHSQTTRSGVEHSRNAGLHNGHVRQTIDAL